MSTNDPAIPARQAPRPNAPGPRQERSGRPGIFAIYKPGQGYYTRTLSAIGAATLVLAGVAWLWGEMNRIQHNTVYWQAGMAVALIGGFGLFLFLLLNKPKVADFMIATEAEMKKVNWPSRREIIGATLVVIGGTLLVGLLLFIIDIIFGWFFLNIGILESSANDVL